MTPGVATHHPHTPRRQRLLAAASGLLGGLVAALCFALLWAVQDAASDPLSGYLFLVLLFYVPVALLVWAPVAAWTLAPRLPAGSDRALMGRSVLFGTCLGVGTGAGLMVAAALLGSPQDSGPAAVGGVLSGVLGGLIVGVALKALLWRPQLPGPGADACRPASTAVALPAGRLIAGALLAFVVVLSTVGLLLLWLMATFETNI